MAEPVTLDQLKRFANIDHSEDDDLLTSLALAAREFVETSIGASLTSEEAVVSERARLAIMSLAHFWYDNRLPAASSADGNTRKAPFHVKAMLAQLRGGRLEPPCDEDEA